MRSRAFVWTTVVLALAAGVGVPRGHAGKETKSAPVADLIKQLGDAKFVKREAACKELEAIGAPALGALRKAVASSDDAEIRKRSERLLKAIAVRTRKTSISRRWTGHGVNSLGQQSPGEMVVTEQADGTLTGKWGAPMHLSIENGERLTEETLRWDGSDGKGTYRARCTQRGNSLVIDWTYYYVEDGNSRSHTGRIVYTRQ